MRVVLPREPDAAEDLDAVLARSRTPRRARARVAADDASGRVAVVECGLRGVPRRGARELDAATHVGALVLDALELPDRSAELHTVLGVLGRGVHAPLRDADELGRDQRRGELADLHGVDAVEATLGAARRLRRRVTSATRRVGSTLGSSRTPAPSPRSSATQVSPSPVATGATSTSARCAPSTGRTVPRDGQAVGRGVGAQP